MLSQELLCRVAEGYVRSYRTFYLNTSNRWADLTQIEIQHFAQLGIMLGYTSIREEAKKDLIWKDPFTNQIAFYLERESKEPRAVTHTLSRLLKFGSHNTHTTLCAIWGWVTENTLKQIVVQLQKNRPASFLGIAWIGDTADSATRVLAIVLDGLEITYAYAEGKTDEDNYWYCMFPKVFDTGRPWKSGWPRDFA